MRAAAIALVLLGGCASARLVRWQPEHNELVIEAPLCGFCTEPSAAAGEQMRKLVLERCGRGGGRVLEEGTTTSKGVAVAGGYGGTTEAHAYYWRIRCR